MSAKTQLTYPDGSVVDYTYDTNNRLIHLKAPSPLAGEGGGEGHIFSFAYDTLGRKTKLSMPNGTYATYAYDNGGRLTNLTHKTSSGSTIDSFDYTLDKVGNRLTKSETHTKYTYTYDTIYRLLQSLPTTLNAKDKDHDNKTETFTYDPAGNRLTGPETNDAYIYNQGNHLTSDKKHQYEYDRNGNLIKKIEIDDEDEEKVWTYTYDYENRLIKAVEQEDDETRTITFTYDPFGRRIEKKAEETEDGKTESKTYTYIYDNQDIILEYLTKTEDNETNTQTTKYIHGQGIDEPLAIQRKGETYYYHPDGLGSITALTDKKQKIVESYTYDSFGNLKRKGDKVKNAYTFTGREYDRETGLYYYRVRYYDAEIGRFISFDPILHPANGTPKIQSCTQTFRYPAFESLKEEPQKMNPFILAENNPINKVDPFGLQVQQVDECCRECAQRIAREMWQRFPDPQRDNFMRHCVASCEVSKQCPRGRLCAWAAGWWNEFTGVFDRADVIANREGRECSYSISCETCCQNKLTRQR